MQDLPANNEILGKVILDARQKELIKDYSALPQSVLNAMDSVNNVLQSNTDFKIYIPIDRHGKPFYTEKELVSQLQAYASAYKNIYTFLEEDLLPAIKK